MNTGVDQNIIKSLLHLCNEQYAPGALLRNHNPDSLTKQLSCIETILYQTSAKYVLETGTESGMFCYFAKCVNPDIEVVTFGMNEGCNHTGDMRSKKCTDFLNERFQNYIEYIEGDSRLTLTQFKPKQQIDFAWIDGGHNRDILSKDLENCLRLKIPHVCVDDYNMIVEVKNTVEEFLDTYPNNYKKQFVTDEERGICYLKYE